MSRREHVFQLASEIGVELILDKHGDYAAWWVSPGHIADAGDAPWFRGRLFTKPTAWVEGWSPRDQYSYFGALHELGHAARGHNEARKSWTPADQVVTEEVEAWEWAFEHSLEAPNTRTLRLIFDDRSTGLGSYLHYERPSDEVVEDVIGLRRAVRGESQ